eukprot:496918-Prorocentrum_minimum.AAC.2
MKRNKTIKGPGLVRDTHHHVEQLLLQALLRHRVVDHHGLAGHLGAVVRVGQLAGEEQSEGVVPLNLLVAQHDHLAALHLRDVLLEHWVDGRVDVLVHVLKQKRVAVRDRHLQMLQKVRVVERLHLALQVLALALLDPVHRLHLRVDAQREAVRARGEDAVLHGELVARQPLRGPDAHLHLVGQQRLQLERQREGHLWCQPTEQCYDT